MMRSRFQGYYKSKKRLSTLRMIFIAFRLIGRGSNLGSSARRTEASAFKDRVDRVWERASSRERRERRSPRKRSRSPRRSRSPLRSRSPQKSPVSSKSPPRSRSPHSPSSRAKSPQRARRSIRVTSRYTVQIPKISLDLWVIYFLGLSSFNI